MNDLTPFWRRIGPTAELLLGRVLGWQLEVDGQQHLPVDGGAVLAFNHHGYLDIVLVASAPVLELRRPVRFLAKAELFRHWASRWLVTGAGCVPVERGVGGDQARAQAYGTAVDALRAGEFVAVAPEQTISESFELLPFKGGAARMATAADVPLIPAIGWGSHRAFTKGQPKRPRRGIPVIIRYGAPVHPRPGEDITRLTARLRDAMGQLLDEVQRSYPDAGTPGDDWWVPARLGGSAPAHTDVVARNEERFALARAAREEAAHRASGPRLRLPRPGQPRRDEAS